MQVPKGSKKSTNLHDLLFREVFSEPRYCLDIFRLVFKPKVFDLFNWKTLRSEATVVIDEAMKEKRTDLTFSVGVKGSRKRAHVIFLLEHKSEHDKDLLLQLLEYQVAFYRKNPNDPIIPILLYHGKKKEWRHPLNFQDNIKNMTEGIRREFGKDILNFNCQLLNLHKVNTLRGKAKTLVTKPILFIMSHIWNVNESVLAQLFEISKGLGKSERSYLLEKSADYARRYNRKITFEMLGDIEKKVVKQEDQRIMALLTTTAEELKNEGREEGREEGRVEGRVETAIQMLKGGLSIDEVKKYTGLADQVLEKLMIDLAQKR